MIRRIWANNFKSLRNFELALGSFNVLVGANAAGKSNIIQAISFVQDALASSHGVVEAVTSRGDWLGITTAQNINLYTILGFHLEYTESSRKPALQLSLFDPDEFQIQSSIDYELVIAPQPPTFRIISERFGIRRLDGEWERIICYREDDLVHFLGGIIVGESGRRSVRIPSERLAISLPFYPCNDVGRIIGSCQFLKIVPDNVREGISRLPQRHLRTDGQNLPAFLRTLTRRQKSLVCAAMARDVPGFVSYDVHNVGKKLMITIDEDAVKGIPIAGISDGTITLLAIYAYYYSQQRPPLLCVEEPENGVHPELIGTLVEYLHAMSQQTQVIITTHSPLLVDQCSPDEIVLLDKVDGSTRAMRVPERAHIEQFLQDFSLGELWTRDFLDEIVHNGVGTDSSR